MKVEGDQLLYKEGDFLYKGGDAKTFRELAEQILYRATNAAK